MFAAAREEVIIRIKATDVCQCIGVQIGCHTDKLWKLAHQSESQHDHHTDSSKKAAGDYSSWIRYPAITLRRAMASLKRKESPGDGHVCLSITSNFGGLVYFTTNPSCTKHSGHGAVVDAHVQRVHLAPLFLRDRTSPEEWRSRLFASNAPWGELVGHAVVLTLPLSLLKAVRDPAGVVEFWDSVVMCYGDLAPHPSATEGRLERIVVDVQTVTGTVHAGYPLVVPIEMAKRLIDLEHLRKDGFWSVFHELGHNFQDRAWTFDRFEEVTCNLFVAYAYEHLIHAQHEKLRDLRRVCF